MLGCGERLGSFTIVDEPVVVVYASDIETVVLVIVNLLGTFRPNLEGHSRDPIYRGPYTKPRIEPRAPASRAPTWLVGLLESGECQ